jgi:uncharacterized pyridoxamine 5'-phosphate oxidase family protein
MEWKENFYENDEVVLATSSKKGEPNAIVVIFLGFVEDKLLIADCQMDKTITNIKENKNVAIVSKYIRILGTAEVFSSGKYLDLCVEKCEGYEVKNAIVIDVDSVFDLDELELLYESKDKKEKETSPKPKTVKKKTTTKTKK